MADTILYLAFNDGSDMRINKEVRTLSQLGSVTMVAIGSHPSQCYAKAHVSRLHFIQGSRKSPWGLVRYFTTCIRLLLFSHYHSVHIINEPQAIVLWPFLLRQNVVLDLFDSIFLRRNQPGNQRKLLKRLVYAPARTLLVTDEKRLELLPDFLKAKASVLPNYPYRMPVVPEKDPPNPLAILYYGWLGEKRGTETIRNILAADPNLRVLMAGWIADQASHDLTRHPRVEWMGVLPQNQALWLAAERAHYILCVYAPVNHNNIHASPNKIYDAIQTRTPVIINQEIKVAGFVAEQKIGYIMPCYDLGPERYQTLVRDLHAQVGKFNFPETMRNAYTWEEIEGVLLEAHR